MAILEKLKSSYQAFLDSNVYYGFKTSRSAKISFFVLLFFVFIAVFAKLIAPYNTIDPSILNLQNADLPPAWIDGGSWNFIIGTDDQGRDLLSAIILGVQLSFEVAIWAVIISLIFGVVLGLLSGYFGGWVDALIMRIVDVQLSLPSVLMALMVNGIAVSFLEKEDQIRLAVPILIIAIAISTWVNYARTVRSSVMVQRRMEYVQAAEIAGFKTFYIILRHVLPNVAGPILVLVSIDFATCIILEASLSFLGVGLPPTMPSIGTLIRIGSDYLFSGQWWVVFFSGFTLFAIAVCVNLVGDRLRDILNPKIQ